MPLPEDFGTAFTTQDAPEPAAAPQPLLGLPSDFGQALQDDGPQDSPLDMVERNAHLTAGQNSSSYFQDKQTADTLGLDVDLVSRNRETTSLDAFKANLIKTLAYAPGTAAFFAEDRHNLWAAKDEAQALVQIEQRWKELLLDPAKSVAKQAAKAPFSILGSLPYNTVGAVAGALDFVETNLGKAMGTGSTGAFGSVRDWAMQNSQWITENILQSDLLSLSDDLKGKGLYENPELLLDPEWLTYNVGEAATSILPQLLAAKLTGGSTLIGSAIGGVQEGGDLYRELLNDGVDPQAAFSWSAFFGTTTMALNKFGLDAILGKGAIEKITSKAVKALISGGTEGVTEWLEEPFQAFSKGMAEGNPLEDIGAAVMESLKNIDVIPGAFLLGGGTSMVASVAEDRAKEDIERAAAYRDKMVETHKAIQATQVQQNDPVLMETFLNVAGLGEDVYIDGELLLQSPDLLQRLGVDQTLAEDAALSGRSVRVNTAALWTRLSEQELEGLKDDIRPAPSAMSAREAESYDPVQALRDIEEALAPDVTTIDPMETAGEWADVEIELDDGSISAGEAVGNIKARMSEYQKFLECMG